MLENILRFIEPRLRRLPGLTCCIAVAGCSQFTEPSWFRYVPSTNGAVYGNAGAKSYSILHSFGYGSDGNNPVANLADVNGTLYATTPSGGAYSGAQIWGGTVFSVTVSGKERVLHSFGNGPDGNQPEAGVIAADGVLYGTTRAGGANDRGTVFSIGTTGAHYRVLYSFGEGRDDGYFPFAPLIDVKGTLYGTTSRGGAHGFNGTVFTIGANGANYRILHQFGKGSDGRGPAAGLVDVNDVLYGTTAFGGSNRKCPFPYYSVVGCGTVFSITTAGTHYRVLHRFGKGRDGIFPVAALDDVNGTFYGTTRSGGAHDAGTIFSISASGLERVIYSASSSTPAGWSGLTDANGTLYGTYPGGGTYGGGVAFSVSTTGEDYTVLHSFGKGFDGDAPWAGMIDLNDKLYGTTSCGGRYSSSLCGDNGLGGNVFELTP